MGTQTKISAEVRERAVRMGLGQQHERCSPWAALESIAAKIGCLAAALGGVDSTVFTGGIGENAVAMHAGACEDAAWLGVELDAKANAKGGPLISSPGSRVQAWVIPTNEELMIARHTFDLLGRASRRASG